MIEYIVNDTKYSLSYKELKWNYERFISMTDYEFMDRLAEATHLACVICFLKEITSDSCLCDKGIIHELIHLWHIPEENTTSLKDIRTLFENILKLD